MPDDVAHRLADDGTQGLGDGGRSGGVLVVGGFPCQGDARVLQALGGLYAKLRQRLVQRPGRAEGVVDDDAEVAQGFRSLLEPSGPNSSSNKSPK